MRFIDADRFEKWLDIKISEGLINLKTAEDIASVLKYAPTADVKPAVYGEWIEYPRAHYFKCSKCKYTVPYRKAMVQINGEREYNFCPHCGTEMRGEQK